MVDHLGQYKILDRLGAGGMGEVYRARDTRLGRTVAIKVLPADVADDAERRERLTREAQASAALSHPNIAALYEIGEDAGQLYLVFEFVPGSPLSSVIGGRPLNPRRAIDFAVQIADALAEAHAAGIVHRDIKPGNVIITPKDKAKILDFGLAKWTESGANREQAIGATAATAPGAGRAIGTVAYMSPEQALGEAVDERTDVFSLGAVLYEMLTGRPPFSGATATALAIQIVQTSVPAPSSSNLAVPTELDPIVASMLAKSPTGRQRAATLAAELRAVAAMLDIRSDAADLASAPELVRGGSGVHLRPIAALLIVAALMVAGWDQREMLAHAWRHWLGPRPSPIIAVIPLETDRDQTFFADGLTEDLITRLGQTRGLSVIGRSATRALRGRAPVEVARESGAAVVLAGSVRTSGDAVRMSLELVDPRDGTAIWTSQYTHDIKDIFAVQAQVAEDVARALRVTLQSTQASVRTASRLVDARAYESYLRGRQAVAARRPADAIAYFERAVASDDGLAEAHAALAEAAYLEAHNSGQLDDPPTREKIRAAAARSHEFDPDLADANIAMGLAATSLNEALGYMRRAVELDPSNGDAYNQIGVQLLDLAPQQAMGFLRKSLEVDAHYDVSHLNLAIALLALGRAAEARPELAQLPAALTSIRAGQMVAIDLSLRRLDALANDWKDVNVRDLPPMAALGAAVSLEVTGRTPAAIREVSGILARTPAFCEARAVLAGLLLERRDMAGAHRLADPILANAHARNPTGSSTRCGAVAAAAMRDVPALGALYDQIASDDERLRAWGNGFNTVTGRRAVAGDMYPWSRVAAEAALAQPRRRMAEAYQRAEAGAGRSLAGLLK
jgi:TolB-like protein